MALQRVVLFALFLTFLQIWTSSAASISFSDRSKNNWELLIGAAGDEFHFDFCQYNGNLNVGKCKSLPANAFVDIRSECGCVVNDTGISSGSRYFSVRCDDNSTHHMCPKKLTLIYEQGNVEPPAATTPLPLKDETNTSTVWIVLFAVSLGANILQLICFCKKYQSIKLEMLPKVALT